MDTERLERFDQLIALAEEHLECMRGTIYERYAEHLLKEVMDEREEYITYMTHSN